MAEKNHTITSDEKMDTDEGIIKLEKEKKLTEEVSPPRFKDTMTRLDNDVISNAVVKIETKTKEITQILFNSKKKQRCYMPVRPATPMELFNTKFQCSKCPINSNPTEYNLTEFFAHQHSTHQTISCVYCDEEFEFARDIMIHLYREHRLKNQKFNNDEEFLRRGGGRATIICADCNLMLHMSPNSDKNIITNHNCNKIQPPQIYKVQVPEDVKLDPLLLETDTKKRIELLVDELKRNLLSERERRKKNDSSNDLSVLINSEDVNSILSRMIETSSSDCDYCRQARLIRIDKRQLLLHLFKKHDWIPRNEEEVELSPDEFFMKILEKVFYSEDSLIFTYNSPTKEPFGEIPCECLICGFLSTNQINLFPHWRKVHRGMSMKCPMCMGNFLFAGALFSHVCLGTPEHFTKTASSGKVGLPDSNNHSNMNGEGGGMGTSNDTIALRYQCGLCEDLVLPGFFNYMVHLRRDHNRCELCLEAVTNQKELEHHMKKHKLNNFCWKCSVAYVSKPNFLTHLFWKHGTESRECSMCLKKKWPHIYHFCIPPPWFTCDVCGLYFTKSKSLLVHKRLHSKEKLRTCTDCGEKFVSASLLQKHILKKEVAASEDVKINVSESEESHGEEESSEANDSKEEVAVAVESKPQSIDTKEEEQEQVTPIPKVESLPSPTPAPELSAVTTTTRGNDESTTSTSSPSRLELNSTASESETLPEENLNLPIIQHNKVNGYESDESEVAHDEPTPSASGLQSKNQEVDLSSSDEMEDLEEFQFNFNAPAATPRLDLSSTATAMLFEKAVLEHPISPLYTPLQEFNMKCQENITFEDPSIPDHISRENALMSILMEHDYCSRMDPISSPGKRKAIEENEVETPPRTPPKRAKQKKQYKQRSPKKKRRRSRSSSSSSSSSCSSCGSNCSCSSSSSSSSDSDSGSSGSSSDSDSEDGRPKPEVPSSRPQTPPTVYVKPPPKKRGRKPKPKVEEPFKIKKPKGRPPKIKPKPKLPGFKFPSSESDLGNRQAEILKHFENPSDAFILEEDLDTSDSDSEEIFNKKQLTECITPKVPVFDEPWIAGNEKFLLKEVKGVNEIEELRPKPKPLKLSSQKSMINSNNIEHQPMMKPSPFGGSMRRARMNFSEVKNAKQNPVIDSVPLPPLPPSSAEVNLKQVKGVVVNQIEELRPKPKLQPLKLNSQKIITKSNNVEHKPPPPIKQPLAGNVRRARMKITEVKSKPPPPPPTTTMVADSVPPPQQVGPPAQAEGEVDTNVYCICRGPHDIVSQMIGCDDDNCEYQWFHFECVGIVVAPKGKWYCADCKERRRKTAATF